MNRLVYAVALVLLCSSAALAVDYDDDVERLAVKAQVGVGMNTGVAPEYEYLSTAGLLAVDLQYRLNRNVSLVPASVSFYFYSGAANNQGYNGYGAFDQGYTRGSHSMNYVDPGMYSPFYYPDYYNYGYGYPYSSYSPPSLAWAISMTPGIKFQTSRGNLFNLYTQVGAGVYHHNQNTSSYYGVGSLHRTSPAARFESGVEIIVEQHVNLLIGGGYTWIGNNPAYNGLVNLNLGVRLGF